MRDRLYRVEAIILKRTDFGEADRILTLVTPDRGKLRAIAKGARKPSSRKSGHIELFTHSMLLLAKGRHLDVVTQADTLEAFLPLREDLERLGYAYYLAELVDKFSEEDSENRPLYDLLLHALRWLGDDACDSALLARYFELHLLQHVGYRPQLFQCVNCGTAIEPTDNFFSAEAGGVIDPNCMQTQREKIAGHARDAQPIPLNALKVLRFLQSREYETVRSLRLTPEAQAQVEGLMRDYIAHHLERNLKSVEFLRQLKQPFVVGMGESVAKAVAK
ncbi:MAG: DNA repair protein RecO [Chloroflexi bacterium]|nr:DNA repair protein RecO [Chloroflexota bacterium]